MTAPLTLADLDALATLYAAATPGEWEAGYGSIYALNPTRTVATDDYDSGEDAALIVTMHNALPALLAAARDGLKYRWRFSRKWALANGWKVRHVEKRGNSPAGYMVDEPADYNYKVFGYVYDTDDEAWERIERAVERKWDDERRSGGDEPGSEVSGGE